MICPNCSCPCGDCDHYCPYCGMPLKTPEKKGRHWVPIVVMVLLSAIGIGLFFSLPGESSAPGVNGISSGDIPWFLVDDGILYFSEAYYDGGSELTIPDTIGGVKVTALSDGCFENCTELTAVFLPETLQAIGEDAFRGCSALRGMQIPESVRIIGQRAFESCTALEAVSLSDSIQAIGDQAFSDCHKLNYIFFLGNFQTWAELYDGFIAPQTAVFCEDGSFYQGGDPY